MNNNLFFIIILILSLITGLFIFKLANMDKTGLTPVAREDSVSVISISSKTVSEAEPFKTVKEEEPLINKPVSEAEAAARAYAERFDIPKDAEEELIGIIRQGREVAVWPESRMADEEFPKSLDGADMRLPAGLEKPPISEKMKNMVSGYDTEAKDFDKMVSACLPERTYGDSEAATLKARALSNMGFSALMEKKYEDAEKAFAILTDNYPYEEPTQISRLEYSRLLLRQGRVGEAEQILDEAMALNSDNEEYMLMANSLKEKIEEYD